MTAGSDSDAGGTGLRVHVNRLGEWEDRGFSGVGALLRRAVEATVAAEGGAAGEVSVTLLPLDEMEELNRSYLDRSGPTDVIAFDLGEEALLGDVYVAPEMALRAAAAGEAADPVEELVRLAVHGTLHVLGHRHPDDASRWASAMYRRQEELVEKLTEGGVGGPGDGEVAHPEVEPGEAGP